MAILFLLLEQTKSFLAYNPASLQSYTPAICLNLYVWLCVFSEVWVTVEKIEKCSGLWKSSCNLSAFRSAESRIFTVFVTFGRRLGVKGDRVATARTPPVLDSSCTLPGETEMRWRKKNERWRYERRRPDRAVQYLRAFGAAGACGQTWRLICAHPHLQN